MASEDYLEKAENTTPSIIGDKEFKRIIVAGMEFVEMCSPHHLVYVQEYVPLIVEGPGPMAHISGSKCEMYGDKEPEVIARALVHEAAHFEDYSRRSPLGKFAYLFGFAGSDVEVYALEHELDFVKVSDIAYREQEISRIERMIQDVRNLPWYFFVAHRNPWGYVYTGY